MTEPDPRANAAKTPFRLGFFTRLVDDAAPGEVYARALKTFERAEALGYDAGWVAQHHAHQEGGLPSPLVFLAAAAARTKRIRLITGIITLPLEDPLRLAEDAAVLDALSGGRLELGFGTGGNRIAFGMFGRDVDKRHEQYEGALALLREAFAGKEVVPGGPPMWPPAPRLGCTLWEATFHVEGAIRAAQNGSGLLLARTAQRPAAAPGAPRPHLGEVQAPVVDAYLAHWASKDAPPRIGLSRSVYVAPTRAEAIADAEHGMRRHLRIVAQREGLSEAMTTEELLVRSDVHFGTPEEVATSMRADRLMGVATDLMVQVHPVDPPHEKTLRSLELMAAEVAPALGWRPGGDGGPTA